MSVHHRDHIVLISEAVRKPLQELIYTIYPLPLT